MAEIPEAIFPFVRQCAFCKADIVWVVEKSGSKESRIPIHAEPQPDGRLTLTATGVGTRMRLELGRPTELAAKAMRDAGVPLYRRHALLCPHAHRWAQSTNEGGWGHRSTVGRTILPGGKQLGRPKPKRDPNLSRRRRGGE